MAASAPTPGATLAAPVVGGGGREEAGVEERAGAGAEKETAEGVPSTRLLTMLSLGGGCFDDSLLFRFEVVDAGHGVWVVVNGGLQRLGVLI